MTIPRMPLPQESLLYVLREDREIRFLTEALIAVLCLPLAILTLWVLSPGGQIPIGQNAIATSVLAISPLIALALLRRPTVYVLTSHRIGAVYEGQFLWSVRLDRISRIWRLGGTLHLHAGSQRTYSVTNLRHALWLENYLVKRTSV